MKGEIAVDGEEDQIEMPGAPVISGLMFRRFRGSTDYPSIVNVLEKSREVDQLDSVPSVGSIARSYSQFETCNPFKDVLIAEIRDEIIGYSRVWWEERESLKAYIHYAALVPQWRGKRIRHCMVHYSEQRAREMETANPTDNLCFLQSWAHDTEVHWKSVLLDEQYAAIRYNSVMIRSLLEGIPCIPLPEGIKVRPAASEHIRKIWRAADEAFQDLKEGSPLTDTRLEKWMKSPTFTPDLWVVAWDVHNDEVAGSVLNYINEEENRKNNCRKGYTEYITVRRPYRGKGLAKALIARSLAKLKDAGMTEATLTVDTENPSGALRLYKTMRFRTVKQWAIYRKPLK